MNLTTTRTLASTPEVIEHFNPPIRQMVMSRCHRYAGGWKPEEGSAEFIRQAERRAARGRSHERNSGVKFHWEGSLGCSSVIGRWADRAKVRTLDGKKFNTVQVKKRCRTCHGHFKAA